MKEKNLKEEIEDYIKPISTMDRELNGKWIIIEMPDFDEDYIYAEEQAYIQINKNRGEFKFGYVQGYFEIQESISDQEGDKLKFEWEGSDEMDEASGSIWLKRISNTRIQGEILFWESDGHEFIAEQK